MNQALAFHQAHQAAKMDRFMVAAGGEPTSVSQSTNKMVLQHLIFLVSDSTSRLLPIVSSVAHILAMQVDWSAVNSIIEAMKEHRIGHYSHLWYVSCTLLLYNANRVFLISERAAFILTCRLVQALLAESRAWVDRRLYQQGWPEHTTQRARNGR